ncbi:hypothetical protein ACUXHY_002484 [Cytobacillus horneckiae]
MDIKWTHEKISLVKKEDIIWPDLSIYVDRLGFFHSLSV